MEEKDISNITGHLLNTTGFDYSGHSQTMLKRRIALRMDAEGIPSLPEYFSFLKSSPNETEALVGALNITYSKFFRNPLTFEILEQLVLPQLALSDPKRGWGIRIWSAGCATGEEPYSVAMILNNLSAYNDSNKQPRIFATDMDKSALQCARRGQYAAPTLAEVKFGMLNKYFSAAGDKYRLHPEIRNSVHFAQHDLLDARNYAPPESVFGNFDLIFCRNVLIYYNSGFQEHILLKLNRSLNPGGYLVLGEADQLTAKLGPHYIAQYRMSKIYQKLLP